MVLSHCYKFIFLSVGARRAFIMMLSLLCYNVIVVIILFSPLQVDIADVEKLANEPVPSPLEIHPDFFEFS